MLALQAKVPQEGHVTVTVVQHLIQSKVRGSSNCTISTTEQERQDTGLVFFIIG